MTSDPRKVLEVSIDAWRKTRHPRWGQLADWAAARALKASPERPLVGAGAKKADVEAWDALLAKNDPLDLARLLAALGAAKSPVAAERVKALALRDDPRVVSGLLELLEKPPYRARTAMAFFRAVAAALAASKDVRAKEGLASLGGRYKTIVETTVGEELGLLFKRTADELGELEPKALTAAEEKKLAALEASFEAERVAASRQRSETKDQRRSDDELLSAVYAAPDDDAPRLVFADVLTERGDARGELISLQVQRARGEATPELLARERQLLADPKLRVAWSMPLANGGECTLGRGFPETIVLSMRSAKRVVGSPAWATVRRVHGLHHLSLKLTRALLEPEVMEPVRFFAQLSAEQLDAAAQLRPRVPGLSVCFIAPGAALARFPNLVELELSEGVLFEDGVARTFPDDSLAGCPRLQKLSLRFALPRPATFFAAVKDLRELELDAYFRDRPMAPDALGALTKLERLFLAETNVELVRGLPVKWFGTRWIDPSLVGPLVEAVPTLSALEVRASLRVGPFVALLAALRGTKVEVLSLGGVKVVGANRPGATLEVRGVADLQLRLLGEALPKDSVAKVALRPLGEDPARGASTAPAGALERLREAFAPTGAAVEVAWW